MSRYERGTHLLSVTEVSTRLGLSEEQVRRYIRRDELGTIRFGRRVLVHPDDLHEFIDSRRRAGQRSPQL